MLREVGKGAAVVLIEAGLAALGVQPEVLILTGMALLILMYWSTIGPAFSQLKASRPVIFVIVAGIVGFVVFAAVAWRWQPRVGPPLPSVSKPDADETLTVRVKFSSTQIVEVSNEPGHNDTINLDNVATLVQSWDASLTAVGMVLPASPSVTVDRPKARDAQPTADPDLVVKTPGAAVPGLSIRSSRTLKGRYFLFDIFEAKSHSVDVSGRTFRVTLLSVRDKSHNKRKLIAYTFGISEQ